ncbi:MAG: diacylglycerol kinase family protein [Desulfobaccales bacterium]
MAIVNPAAGCRKAAKCWPQLLKASRARQTEVATWWTEGPGHGEFLAARARQQGYERVLAVGGDGTISEVANGLWWESAGRLPSLGLVPLGTGCDYVRNFFPGGSLSDCLTQALGKSTVPVRLAILRVRDFQGNPLERVCLNVLGLGFDARVVERRRRQNLPLAGKTPYLLSGLQELLQLRHFKLTGLIDGEPFAAQAALLVVGLGKYFGGGIKITPLASPQSERLQVVWDEALDPLTLLSVLGKTFTGAHISHPRIHSRFAQKLQLSADPPALVQVEGEPVGYTPLEVCLSPETLHVAVR